VLPELGLDAAEAAQLPIGGDERVDQATLGGIGRLVLVLILGSKGFEITGVFAGDDVGLGMDAGFEGVETRNGLAFRGTRSGGFLGIATVGRELLMGRHEIYSIRG
jgi:hypothetical protein